MNRKDFGKMNILNNIDWRTVNKQIYDDAMTAYILGISYGEYMALKRDRWKSERGQKRLEILKAKALGAEKEKDYVPYD